MLGNPGRPHSTEKNSCKTRLTPSLRLGHDVSRLDRSLKTCTIDTVPRSGRQSTTKNTYKSSSHHLQSSGGDLPGLRVS